MTRQDYVRKFWPLAHALGAEYGISPVAMIAHALKESGAGNERAAERHNYFGFLKAGKHLVYSDDLTGWTAYARRLASSFPAAVAASENAVGFARAVAYSMHPTYVDEAPDRKALYAKTLAAIHRAVAQDVTRLNLRDFVPIAGLGGLVDFLTKNGATNAKAGDGEALIKKLAAYDRDTYRRILRIQIVQAKLRAVGKTNPTRDAEVAKLIARYNDRQRRLKASKLLKVESGVSADVQVLLDTLKGWWARLSGIGAVPLVVIIPVALVTLAGLSYAVYNTWFRDAVQSQKDNDEAAHQDAIYKGFTPEQKKFDDDRSAASYQTGLTAGKQEGGLFSGLQGPVLLIGGLLLFNSLSGRSARK